MAAAYKVSHLCRLNFSHLFPKRQEVINSLWTKQKQKQKKQPPFIIAAQHQHEDPWWWIIADSMTWGVTISL